MSEEIRVSETNAATGETVVSVLEGAELEAFMADRAAMQAEQEAREELIESLSITLIFLTIKLCIDLLILHLAYRQKLK